MDDQLRRKNGADKEMPPLVRSDWQMYKESAEVPIGQLEQYGFIDDAMVESVNVQRATGGIESFFVWISWRNTFSARQPDTVTTDAKLYDISANGFRSIGQEQFEEWEAANIGRGVPEELPSVPLEEPVWLHVLLQLLGCAEMDEITFRKDIGKPVQTSLREFLKSLLPSTELQNREDGTS